MTSRGITEWRTLRACAAPGCRRLFPVAVASSRRYCDDDCDEAARDTPRARRGDDLAAGKATPWPTRREAADALAGGRL